ncbi:MAG: flagellar hook-associated protein FlgK [Betaproteobacteria bacterium]|nr:flagellar hook-associated protein FlgK [Betaproteobacteria bacterium]
MSGLFGIGVSGLNAAQIGLATTSHNITNAATPGYHRQTAVQRAATPMQSGAGFIGQGAEVQTVKRQYDQFLQNQLVEVRSQGAQFNRYLSEIAQIDNVLADSSAGVSPAMQEFFRGLQDVATNPASVPSRQALLSTAQSLAARFQAVNARFDSVRAGINTQIDASVTAINTYAAQIAELNDRIVLLGGAGEGQPPNDLLDQRDQLVSELNQQIRTTVVKQSDGAYNLFIGTGQSLVVGNEVSKLVATDSTAQPGRTVVAYQLGSTQVELAESSLTGGNLGGLIAFRANSLDAGQAALGRVAIGLAQSFNDQHRLGQDLTGALGGNFFNVGSPAVAADTDNIGTAVIGASLGSVSALTTSSYQLSYDGANYTLIRTSDGNSQTFATLPQTVDGVVFSLTSGAPAAGDRFLIQPTINGARDFNVLINDTARIAAAAPIRASAALANTGRATVTPGSVNPPPPPNANLTQPVSITFTSATTFNVVGTGTGNPVGVAYTSGGNITYNGWTIQISGTPAIGDVFTIGPNTSGTGDNRNALALAGLQTSALLANGTASIQDAYAQLVSEIGNKTRELQVSVSAQDSVIQQTEATQQSLAGVNLDEEAANLIRYQQSYQAAGKVLQIAASLFQSILDIGG